MIIVYSPGQLIAESVPKQLLNISKQVALGLHYLACRGFVHRDLAARNVLVSNKLCKVSLYVFLLTNEAVILCKLYDHNQQPRRVMLKCTISLYIDYIQLPGQQYCISIS